MQKAQLLKKLKSLYNMKGAPYQANSLKQFHDDLSFQVTTWDQQIDACRKNGDAVAVRMYRGFKLVDQESLGEINGALAMEWLEGADDAEDEFDAMFADPVEREFDSLCAKAWLES